jgi:hypothetical protein
MPDDWDMVISHDEEDRFFSIIQLIYYFGIDLNVSPVPVGCQFGAQEVGGIVPENVCITELRKPVYIISMGCFLDFF